MNDRQDRLSRLVSHALRHDPWRYELELDDEGWAPIDMLTEAIRTVGDEWRTVTEQDLQDMIRASPKRRHELADHRIRALYGHSVPGRVSKIEIAPPDVLFHGTSPQAWSKIKSGGLRPMGRQYVHLSTDVDLAAEVGRRKASHPMILTVQATKAREAGSRFWRGNEAVWLADHIDAEQLTPS